MEGIHLMLSTETEGGMNDYFILPYYEKFQNNFTYLCTYHSLIIVDYIAIPALFFSLSKNIYNVIE